MYLHKKLENRVNFFRKIKDLDFILLLCILLLGLISLATMYSTDSGELLFHTKSHFFKFVIFTFMMLLISFLLQNYSIDDVQILFHYLFFHLDIMVDLSLQRHQNYHLVFFLLRKNH